jgi:hypothetical protein
MGSILKLTILFVGIGTFSAQAQYYCSADAKRDGLLYRDLNATTWEVANLRFEKTPYLDSYLSCIKFLEKIPKAWHRTAKLTPLYPDTQKIVRFQSQDPLIQLCLDTPACHLSFFENFFYPKALYRNFMKAKVFLENPSCRQPIVEKLEPLTEKPLHIIPSLPIRSVWKIPEESLDGKFFEKLDREKPKKIYLSSMIISEKILNQLERWLIKNPESEAWVFLAYNLHVLENDFPEKYQPKTERLHFFPVFQTPWTKDSYHIKGAAFEGKTFSTLLMTVNMRRFREEKVADRIFELEGKEVFQSYVDVLHQVLTEQCSQLSYLNCSNELRYEPSDPRSKIITQWIENSCKTQSRFLTTNKEPTSFFTRTQNTDLENQFERLITQAEKSILISSHVFHESKISTALLMAASRGVKVKLLVGTEITDQNFLTRISKPLSLKMVTKESGVTSHAKFMVIDNEVVVWGTGNFTKTSLQNPWEIFIVTKDKKIINELVDYSNQYH